DVTIKPYSGHSPTLSLGLERERDAALFRLHDASVTLEDLQFHLKPRRVQPEAQAVVKVVGLGLCQFKGCVAAREEAENVKIAVVGVDDPPDAMKMGAQAPRQAPKARLEGCFVRGDGELIGVRASRQFELEVEQSLVALNGSLLVVDGNPKDVIDRPAQ